DNKIPNRFRLTKIFHGYGRKKSPQVSISSRAWRSAVTVGTSGGIGLRARFSRGEARDERSFERPREPRRPRCLRGFLPVQPGVRTEAAQVRDPGGLVGIPQKMWRVSPRK